MMNGSDKLSLVLVFAMAISFASPLPRLAHGALTQASPEASMVDSRRGTRVIHFGDSFATAGLFQSLRPKFKELGVQYEAHARASSTTYAWAYGQELPQLLAKRPDLVIVTLGANEMFVGHPEDRQKAIRTIVKKIGDRPCVWVAPPPWKSHTGILDVIRDNISPCLYFDSEAEVDQPIERRKDGIHPSLSGGRVWAEALWDFIERHREPEKGPWALKGSRGARP